jgi:hypothetical protein
LLYLLRRCGHTAFHRARAVGKNHAALHSLASGLPSGIDKTDRASASADRPSRILNELPDSASIAQRDRSGNFASSRRLMSDRIGFEIVCPNDHDQTVRFSQEEFEKALKSGVLVFHCNTCDTDWSPSHDDIAKFRKQFSKNSS